MGSGYEKLHDSANILLLDDNCYSIVNGIEDSRLLFDNMKKMIAYSLSSSIPEILPFVFSVVF